MKYKYGIDDFHCPILLRQSSEGYLEYIQNDEDGISSWKEWDGNFVELPLEKIHNILLMQEDILEYPEDFAEINKLIKEQFYGEVLSD